jgi:type VII secretion integral membrane protein EccD
MTTPPPVAPPVREVCRVTIEGPTSRADLALPVSTAIAELLPALLPHVAPQPADRSTTPWVLQRLGEAPLDPDGTPETLGLRHGDVLHLRPEDDPLPALHFDDIADGVAHTLNNQPGRWRPELTRRFTLALASLTLAVLAITVLSIGPGPLTAAVYAAIALILAGGSVVGRREGADGGAVLTAALAACAFAGAAGLALPSAADSGFDPGVTGLAMAVSGVAVMAAVLLAFGPLPLTVAGTALTTAAVTAIAIILFVTLHLDPAQTAGLVAVAMFIVGHFAPNLALRLAQLRVPHLPHDAEELQEDIEPEPEERVALRVTAASAYLNILSLTCAVAYAVAFWLLAQHPGWIGWALPPVFSCAVVLHSRDQTGVLQRISAVLVGWFGIALVLTERVAGTGLGDWSIASGLLLAAAVLLLVGAWRLPTSRLRPVWGHIGDILEMLSTIALLPLLLQLLHVYAYFRALAG